MDERWIPIPEWEGLYEVSDLGRVRSVDRILIRSDGIAKRQKGIIRKPVIDSRGYPYVRLSDRGRFLRRGVHQLVLLAFVGPRPEGFVARHLNGNSSDPRLVNLAYGTHRENSLDTVRHGANWQSKKTHCKRGHELNDQNTRWWCTGTGMRRYCRPCQAMNARAYKERKGSAA